VVLLLVRMRCGPQRISMPSTQGKSHRKCETRGRAQGDGSLHEGRSQNIAGWDGCAARVHPGKTVEQTIMVYTTTRAVPPDAARRRPAATVSTTTTTATWWTMGPTTTTATTTATAVGTEQPATTMGTAAPTGQQQLATTVAQMTVRGNAG